MKKSSTCTGLYIQSFMLCTYCCLCQCPVEAPALVLMESGRGGRGVCGEHCACSNGGGGGGGEVREYWRRGGGTEEYRRSV